MSIASDDLNDLVNSICGEICDFSGSDFVILRADSLTSYGQIINLNLSNQLLMGIENDAFVSLVHMETLNLSNNLIKSLDGVQFANNTKLKSINFSYNCFQSFENPLVFRSKRLLDLNLSYNSIVSVPKAFVRSSTLNRLNLSNNKIETVNCYAFCCAPRLKILNLSRNKIRQLKIFSITLRTFYANDNDVQSVNLLCSRSLQVVHVRNNCIANLENWLVFENELLTELDLLTDATLADAGIDYITKKMFVNNKQLRILRLNVKCVFHMECLDDLEFLRTFHLIYKGAVHLVPEPKFLSDFFANKKKFENLTLICLNFFNIYAEKMDQLKNLKRIHFECLQPQNHPFSLNIENVFNSNPVIESVYLKNLNNFMLRPHLRTPNKNCFRHTHKISAIGLHQLEIRSEFRIFDHLLHLDLSYGLIRELTECSFQALKFLRYLSLNNCKLMYIVQKIFQSNINLEHLNLKNNRIFRIDRNTFAHLANLKFLDLRNNLIGNLTDDYFINLNKNNTKLHLN